MQWWADWLYGWRNATHIADTYTYANITDLFHNIIFYQFSLI